MGQTLEVGAQILLVIPHAHLTYKGLVGQCSKLVVFGAPTRLHWEAECSWGPLRLLQEAGQAHNQTREVRGPCTCHLSWLSLRQTSLAMDWCRNVPSW